MSEWICALALQETKVLRTILWRFSTAWYGSLLGGFPLGTVPPRLRFQANRSITKTWSVNSDWPEKIVTACVIELATWDTTDPLDLNQHSQQRIERNCFEWLHLFFNNQKMAVSWSVEEVQTFLSLIAEERIQRELDGATQNEKVFRSHGNDMWIIPPTLKRY